MSVSVLVPGVGVAAKHIGGVATHKRAAEWQRTPTGGWRGRLLLLILHLCTPIATTTTMELNNNYEKQQQLWENNKLFQLCGLCNSKCFAVFIVFVYKCIYFVTASCSCKCGRVCLCVLLFVCIRITLSVVENIFKVISPAIATKCAKLQILNRTHIHKYIHAHTK